MIIIEAPRQRNTDEENEALKESRVPDEWAAKPAKLRQKDRDGRWALKRGRRKKRLDGSAMMEVGTDQRYRFIRTWAVTDAARYDGRELGGLLDKTNTASPVWADMAYRSKKNEKKIAKAGLVSKIHYRNGQHRPQHASIPVLAAQRSQRIGRKRYNGAGRTRNHQHPKAADLIASTSRR